MKRRLDEVNPKENDNEIIELTDEEKAEARRNAIQQATNEAYAKITRRNSPKKNQETQSDTLTLF